MAEKMSAFGQVTSLAGTDRMVLVDGIGGTPDNKTIDYSDLLAQLATDLSVTAGSGFIDSATVGTAANTLEVEFTLASSVKQLDVVLENIQVSAINIIFLQLKQGGSWTASGYAYLAHAHSSSGATNFNANINQTGIGINNSGTTWGLPASTPMNGHIVIAGNVSGTGYKTVHSRCAHDLASGAFGRILAEGDAGAATGAVQGVRLLHFDSGETIDAGTIYVYGRSAV